MVSEKSLVHSVTLLVKRCSYKKNKHTWYWLAATGTLTKKKLIKEADFVNCRISNPPTSRDDVQVSWRRTARAVSTTAAQSGSGDGYHSSATEIIHVAPF